MMTSPRRVDVAYVFVLDDLHQRVLMVLNENGRWSLPGGKREDGETLQEAAAREALEETGLIVQVGDVVHVSERIGETHDLFVTFWAELQDVDPAGARDPEIQQIAWVDLPMAQRLMPQYEHLDALFRRSAPYQSRRGE
jgi:8-oxo-dGTP diphosphatase